MKYGIIIPTFNNAKLTIDCIESVNRNTQDFCIYWVDDGSDVEDFEQVRNFLDKSKINYYSIKNDINLGFIKTVNKGIKKVLQDNVEYIVILNNDTTVHSSRWVDSMSDVLIKNEKIGVVGPLCPGSFQSPNFLAKYDERFPQDISDKYKTETHQEVNKFISKKYKGLFLETYDRLAFFCVMIRPDIIKNVGLLDEIYGYGYYDDDDLCERIFRKGWRGAVVCDVFVTHESEKSFEKKFQKEKWSEVKKEMYKKNKDIFDKKFGYGDYEEIIPNADANELQVRLWRKKRKVCILEKEIKFMQESKFWKIREKYVSFKDRI
jgi:GT2 family glycosyltransferase